MEPNRAVDEPFSWEEVFSIRTCQSLQIAGIATLDSLVVNSARELLELKNFGERSLAEVRRILAARGLTLRGDPHRFVEHWARMRDCLSQLVQADRLQNIEPDELLKELFQSALAGEPDEFAEVAAARTSTPADDEVDDDHWSRSTAMVDPYLSRFAVDEILEFVGRKDLMGAWIRGPLEVEVNTGFQAGPLCGSGHSYKLRYEDGQWRQISGERWIS